MTRYTVNQNKTAFLEPSPDGNWVWYSDAAAELEALQTKLNSEQHRGQEVYERLCDINPDYQNLTVLEGVNALYEETQQMRKRLSSLDSSKTTEEKDLRTQNRELREWLNLFVELGDGESLIDGLKRQHQQKYDTAYSHGQKEALAQEVNSARIKEVEG